MRIFGFGNRQDDLSEEDTTPGLTIAAPQSLQEARETLAPGNPILAARIDMAEQIGLFIVINGLDINPRNLTIAHTILSGSNLRLSHKIAKRQYSGQPITQDWLEEIMAHAAEIGDREELEQMLLKLGETMGRFIDTAREAGEATSSYSSAMQEHARSIEAMADGRAVDMGALTRLTRAMIERTWQVEEHMHRSEQEAASLRQKLEHAKAEAGIDHLTGLPNRRAFEAVFQAEYRKARTAIDHLTIAFCDIDHFKAVNDTHGHDTGDRVIQCLAELFLQISDQNCHVARHGGEEFVLLFRGLGAQQTLARLDGLRESFALRRMIDRDTNLPIGFITFSGGVADVFAYEEPRAALKAADEALYTAKRSGRNRIIMADIQKFTTARARVKNA